MMPALAELQVLAGQPAGMMVIDIETGYADENAIEAQIKRWTPPGNVKDPEKIEARRAEAAEKIREQSALLDAAPITVISAKTETATVIFTAFQTSEKVEGVSILPANSEKEMLMLFSIWANVSTAQDTVIAGHNIIGFDLPKLRGAYLRHRQPLPGILSIGMSSEDRNPVLDSMLKFRYFSAEHSNGDWVGLDVVAASLGVRQHKNIVSGADVPRLHAEGKYRELLLYAALDISVEWEVCRLMAGL